MTTCGHGGYFVVIRVNSTSYNVTKETKTYDGIQFKTRLTNVSGNGVKIAYTLLNTGDKVQNVSFAIHADAEIVQNDRVPIYRLPNMEGIWMKDNEYRLYLRFKKNGNFPPLDSIWYGFWNSRENYLWVNATKENYTTGDSGFTYSIQDRTMYPNQQLQFVSAATSDPDINLNEIFNAPSDFFTPSNQFTPSYKFTTSSRFSKSYLFTNSNKFTSSQYFSLSLHFTKSELFAPSQYFTGSDIFTKTKVFTQTTQFTMSDVLTESNIFSDSFSFKPTPTESIFGQVMVESMSYSHTYKKVKTVVFKTDYISGTCTVCYSNSECELLYKCPTLIPYIIYSYSPIYVLSNVYLCCVKKKTFTQAQLIGIISGSAAALFSIIGIVIIIKNRQNMYKDVSFQDDSSSIESGSHEETKTAQVEVTSTVKTIEVDDIDNWL